MKKKFKFGDLVLVNDDFFGSFEAKVVGREWNGEDFIYFLLDTSAERGMVKIGPRSMESSRLAGPKGSS